jgi:hypothetical protein
MPTFLTKPINGPISTDTHEIRRHHTKEDISQQGGCKTQPKEN